MATRLGRWLRSLPRRGRGRALTEAITDARHEAAIAMSMIDRTRAIAQGTAAVVRVLTGPPDGGGIFGGLGGDLKVAWRRLVAAPGFAIFAVVSLALGIGSTTAIYAAIRTVMAPPDGVVQPERVVRISRDGSSRSPLSFDEFNAVAASHGPFASVAGWRHLRTTIVAEGQSMTGFSEAVSGDYFRTLGIRPALGRLLQPADDRPSPPVVVIGQGTWRAIFGRDPEVIGRAITISGVSMTIVGVASAEFSGLFNGGLVPTVAWIPMSSLRLMNTLGTVVSFDAGSSRRWIMTLARLSAGRSIAEAASAIEVLGASLERSAVDDAPMDARVARPVARWTATSTLDESRLQGPSGVAEAIASVLMIAMVLVLLVACTNLANLALARAARSTQEVAVRGALGGSRWRLFRAQMGEAAIIATLGGALGAGVARVILHVLSSPVDVTAGLTLQLRPVIDAGVFAAAASCTVLSLVVAGAWPAWRASRPDVRNLLTTEGLGVPSTRWRTRRYLLVAQLTISTALLIVAGLCVNHVTAEARRDRGYDADQLAFVEVNFQLEGMPGAEAASVVETWLERASRLPEVQATAAVSGLTSSSGLAYRRARLGTESNPVWAQLVAATPDATTALGLTLREGRGVSSSDTTGAPPVVVLGELTARRLFGSTSALGQTLTVEPQNFAGEPLEAPRVLVVIGVVRETTAPERVGSTGLAIVPLAQRPEQHLLLVARANDPTSLTSQLRQVLSSVAPGLGVVQVATGEVLADQQTLFFRITAGLATTMGGLAVVIALSGLYGILSYVVAGRTREMGIRLALGADPNRLRWLVIREGLTPVALGLTLGVGAALLFRAVAAAFVSGLAPGVSTLALASVVVLFMFAGTLACYVPARRAARVGPQVALRNL